LSIKLRDQSGKLLKNTALQRLPGSVIYIDIKIEKEGIAEGARYQKIPNGSTP